MSTLPPINDTSDLGIDIAVDHTEAPADPEHADDGIMAFRNVGFLEQSTGVPMSHRLDPSLAERGFEARLRTWRPR